MNIISKVHCLSNVSYPNTSNLLEDHGVHDKKGEKINTMSREEDPLQGISFPANCDTR